MTDQTFSTMQFFFIFLIVLTVGLAVYQYVGSVHRDLDTRSIVTNKTVLYTAPVAAITGREVVSKAVYSVNDSYLQMNGLNNYVSLNGKILNNSNTTSFTFSAWVKRGVQNLSNNKGIVDKRLFQTGTSYNGTGLMFSKDTNKSYISVGNGINLTEQTLYSDTVLNLNTWYNIVGSYNVSNLIACVNGVCNSSNITLLNGVTNLDLDIRIGNSHHSAGYFNGSIDEVRVYNRSLSQAEITQIYNSGRIANSSLPSSGLVAWFPFDEYGGTTVYNLANTSNNGVIYGT
jgi:hypothetical protein